MLNGEGHRIKLERTEESLTGQGGFLALLEYIDGMRIGERVTAHLPAPGSNRGYDPSVFVQALMVLFAMGGRRLSDLRDLEREEAQYSYLNEKGYMPMMAALYENGLFIDDEFREGNESPQNGHVEVCRRSKALVARAGKRIVRFRADSAVKQIIDRISKSAWVRVSDDVEVAETVHARTRDRSTPLSGRLVSYRYWVVASTSLPTSRPPASWNNTSSGESSRTSSRGSRAMGASDTCRPERAMPTRSGSGSAFWSTA